MRNNNRGGAVPDFFAAAAAAAAALVLSFGLFIRVIVISNGWDFIVTSADG